MASTTHMLRPRPLLTICELVFLLLTGVSRMTTSMKRKQRDRIVRRGLAMMSAL